jgi:phosphatidate cytidylyltransferase
VPAAVSKPVQPNGTHSKANGHGNGHHPRQVESQPEPAVPHVSAAASTTHLAKEVTSPQPQAQKVQAEPVVPVEEKPSTLPNESSAPPPVVDEEKVKQRQKVLERVVWTFIMIFGFIGTS